MASMHTSSPARWLALLAGLLLLALPQAADAGKKKKAERYYFEVAKVTLAEGIPAEVATMVATQLAERIEAHAELLHQLEGAPDPDKQPKKYKKWLARRKLRAFKVNVEVTDYRHELEQLPAPRRGQRLTVSVELRTFGETIPGRVMAFSGEGSATVKLDIGKRLRKRDSEVGNHDAIELSIDKALAESIRKLRMGPRAKPGKK
jgi:hypothetical protein